VSYRAVFIFFMGVSAGLAGPVGIESYNSNIMFPGSAPSSLLSGSLERNSYAYGFVEKTGFTLTQALPVDMLPTGYPINYDLTSDTNPGFLPAGLTVNSYFIHFDPVGSSNATIQNPGTVRIVFEEAFHIAGIQVTRLRQGNAASNQLHMSGVTYETRSAKEYGVELDSGSNNFPDWVHLLDSRTIEIRLHSATDNIDDMRILTATPEPATFWLIGSAVAGLALRRRIVSRCGISSRQA
jgi:hypothetical protein